MLDREDYIAKEVRSQVQVIGFDVDATGTLVKDWSVEGIDVHIGISPAN